MNRYPSELRRNRSHLQLWQRHQDPLHPGQNLNIDVCSECHPFYTGKQKVLDTGGRIDRFKQRFGVFGAK